MLKGTFEMETANKSTVASNDIDHSHYSFMNDLGVHRESCCTFHCVDLFSI